MNDARHKIREFIEPRIPHSDWSDEDDIFALGFVNSLFAMELVLFLEQCFDLRIPNDALDMGNFRSVAAMSGLVERLTDTVEVGGS